MNERSIFLAALEVRDPAERAAYLDQACAGDPAARRGVEELLAAHERSGSFMPEPAAARTTGNYWPGEEPGSRIGPYKLLEKIGEGGMGEVWVADQLEPIRRRVALKVIKPGMDSRSVLARFEAERQALALMDHPNIARVLDAGATDDGRPYFAMELVKGTPITEFCDLRTLSTRERLELFVPVCQAIQHAHQKGIIHRDIKPSNVLVALHDERPVPKVIDFGVAKAIGQPLTEKTIYTGFGALVGTPAYMAPEQATFNQLDIDTRADVYALGVLLYELLTGSPPVEPQRLKQAALDEVLRIVREEEPPRPSDRLSTSRTKATIAAVRRSEPEALSRLMRGELDWVVMKALEKDRTRRYETANGLARDLERYLKDEPVEACPPTVGYRMRKLYQKNRAAVAVAAAFALLLAGAAVAGTALGVQARRAEQTARAERARAEQGEAEANEQRDRAERERRRAEEEKRGAQAVRDFLQNDLLGQADPFRQAEALRQSGNDVAVNPNPTIQELLGRAAAQLAPDRIEARFPNMPFVQAEVLRTVGANYMSLNQGDRKALDLLTRAVELYQKTRGPDDPATLEARQELALANLHPDRLRECEKQLESVRDAKVRVLGPYHPDTISAQGILGAIMDLTGRSADAVAHFQRLRDGAGSHLGPDDVNTLRATASLARSLQMAGRPKEAVRELEGLRDTLRRLKVRFDHPGFQTVLDQLSEAYKAAGRPGDAITLLQEALAVWEKSGDPANPATWLPRHDLAWRHAGASRSDEAIAQFRKNLAAAGNPAREAWTYDALHTLYHRAGRVEEAQAVTRQALDALAKRFGPDNKDWTSGLFRTLTGLALYRQKNYAEAEPLLVRGYQEMDEHIQQLPTAARGQLPIVNRAILDLYRATNRPDEARKWQAKKLSAMETNLKRFEEGSAKVTPDYLTAAASLAQGYVDAGQKEDAFRLFRATSDRLQATGWPLDEASLQALTGLRTAMSQAGRFDLAAGMSAAIVAALRELPEPPKNLFLKELMALGMQLVLGKNHEAAEPPLREALRIWTTTDPGAWNATKMKRWLATALLGQQKYAEGEPMLLEAYKETVERIQKAPSWEKNYPAGTAARLIELYTTLGKPEEVKKWQAERAKHGPPAPRPSAKK